MDPTQNDVNFDSLLTNISVAYRQLQTNFVASQVFPTVTVQKQSDRYATYTKNDWFRDDAGKRADATESEGSSYTLSSDTYFADVYAHHKDIGDQIRKNAASVFNLDKDASELVTTKLLLRQELQFVTDFFTTGKWGTDIVGDVGFTKFSNFAGSNPIGVIATGKNTVIKNTGFEPNTLLLGYELFETLKQHPDFVDRIKYSSSDPVTEQLMAKLFGVERVLVAKAIKATNKEGATGAYDFVFGKNALLCYVAPTPGMLTPSAGYQFVWDYAGFGTNIAISKMRIDTKKCDRIEGEIAWDNKIIGSDLGYFLSGAA